MAIEKLITARDQRDDQKGSGGHQTTLGRVRPECMKSVEADGVTKLMRVE